MHTSTIPASDLTPEMLATWREIQRGNPALRNPFFCPEFTQAAALVQEEIHIGIYVDKPLEMVAFLPFKQVKKGKAAAIQFSDYHGLIAPANFSIDGQSLLRAWGLNSFDFRYVPTDQQPFQSSTFEQNDSHVIDLKQFTDSGKESRKLRKLAREVGPVRFESHTTEPAVLQKLIEWKREHCKRTGFEDLLRDRWTRDLLGVLQHTQAKEFSGQLSALYAGDRLVAAHLGLRSATVWHWWFPSYDAELSKYSPGLLMLLKLIEHAQQVGCEEFDFGVGEEGFKQRFATGVVPVGKGSMKGSGWQQSVAHKLWQADRRISQSRFGDRYQSLFHHASN